MSHRDPQGIKNGAVIEEEPKAQNDPRQIGRVEGEEAQKAHAHVGVSAAPHVHHHEREGGREEHHFGEEGGVVEDKVDYKKQCSAK